MVGPGFPGGNLIAELLRQVTQPLSNAIVRRARKHPFLRKHVLIQLGRFYYWCEGRIQRRIIPAVTRRKPGVDDVRAIELGTKLLLEVLVFGLLWGVIVYEMRKAAERSRVVEQLRVRELNELEAEKSRLMLRAEGQVILTKRLRDIVVEYSRQVECTLPSDPDDKEDE